VHIYIHFLPVWLYIRIYVTYIFVSCIRNTHIHYIFINNIIYVYDDDFLRFVSGRRGIKIYCYFVSTKMGVCVCVCVCACVKIRLQYRCAYDIIQYKVMFRACEYIIYGFWCRGLGLGWLWRWRWCVQRARCKINKTAALNKQPQRIKPSSRNVCNRPE